MSERFAAGGRLIAAGSSPAGRSDARHVAVEFVHPVIVGKRALPAIGLAGGGRTAGGADRAHRRAGRHLHALRPRRLAAPPEALTIEFDPPTPTIRSSPGDRRDALPPAVGARARVLRAPRPARQAGHRRVVASCTRSSARAETDVDARAGGRRGVRADEVRGGGGAARADARRRRATSLTAAAGVLRERFDAGGRLLVLGNGGSATDAMDVAADFRHPPRGAGRRGRCSTSPRTPRSSPRWPTTSASRRCSPAR